MGAPFFSRGCRRRSSRAGRRRGRARLEPWALLVLLAEHLRLALGLGLLLPDHFRLAGLELVLLPEHLRLALGLHLLLPDHFRLPLGLHLLLPGSLGLAGLKLLLLPEHLRLALLVLTLAESLAGILLHVAPG